MFRNSEEYVAAGVVCGLLAVLCAVWYRVYLGIPASRVWQLAAAGLAGGVTWLWATSGHVLDHAARATPMAEAVYPIAWWDGQHDAALAVGTIVLFLVTCGVGVGFLAKLYRAWVMDLASAAEREPNGKGVRAWLSPMNVITGLVIVVGTYYTLGWRVWATALGTVGLLLAYPLLNCLLKGDARAGDDVQQVAEERRRVLALVEAGKITADDGAELIGALGQSRVGEGMRVEERGVMTGNRRVMLLGAALVLVGFCLPWMAVNLGERMNEMVGGMQEQMRNFVMPNGASGLPPGIEGNVVPGSAVRVPVVTVAIVRGGDVAHGLGWVILAMGLGVALLPLVWPARAGNRQGQRSASLVGLVVGTVLVVYLVAGMILWRVNQMEVGFALVIAGYVLLWIGAMREYVRRVMGRPAMAVA